METYLGVGDVSVVEVELVGGIRGAVTVVVIKMEMEVVTVMAGGIEVTVTVPTAVQDGS